MRSLLHTLIVKLFACLLIVLIECCINFFFFYYLTSQSYKLTHLTYKLLPHYLPKCKSDI